MTDLRKITDKKKRLDELEERMRHGGNLNAQQLRELKEARPELFKTKAEKREEAHQRAVINVEHEVRHDWRKDFYNRYPEFEEASSTRLKYQLRWFEDVVWDIIKSVFVLYFVAFVLGFVFDSDLRYTIAEILSTGVVVYYILDYIQGKFQLKAATEKAAPYESAMDDMMVKYRTQEDYGILVRAEYKRLCGERGL